MHLCDAQKFHADDSRSEHPPDVLQQLAVSVSMIIVDIEVLMRQRKQDGALDDRLRMLFGGTTPEITCLGADPADTSRRESSAAERHEVTSTSTGCDAQGQATAERGRSRRPSVRAADEGCATRSRWDTDSDEAAATAIRLGRKDSEETATICLQQQQTAVDAAGACMHRPSTPEILFQGAGHSASETRSILQDRPTPRGERHSLIEALPETLEVGEDATGTSAAGGSSCMMLNGRELLIEMEARETERETEVGGGRGRHESRKLEVALHALPVTPCFIMLPDGCLHSLDDAR
jgi:hypothetical protein